MKTRFEGTEGRRRLIETLCEQRVVANNLDYARRLAEAGELLEFHAGDILIKQGADDNHVFFLLTGEVEVIVNERLIAKRAAKETVGEMSLIDAAQPRSATVRAAGVVVALRIDEPVFVKLLDEFPRMWCPITKTIADRLRQRSQFHRPPNPRPVLFIGSSRESMDIAREIESQLKPDQIDVVVWTSGIFGPSSITIEVLEQKAFESDFALFVFAPDDKVSSRGKDSDAPRDNVIFELGLFIGELGHERTFFIREHTSDLKIPTDLLGITPITYKAGASDLASQLAPACDTLRTTISKAGPR